jgi:hypothetical protein
MPEMHYDSGKQQTRATLSGGLARPFVPNSTTKAFYIIALSKEK